MLFRNPDNMTDDEKRAQLRKCYGGSLVPPPGHYGSKSSELLVVVGIIVFIIAPQIALAIVRLLFGA